MTLVAGRYRLRRPLGEGGMARVELADDVELDRTVAVKLLAEPLARDESYRRRFVQEARLAARLSHPNVVRIYDVGESDGRPYFVMEYVDGPTLADVLAREGRLEPARAAGLTAQAADALAAAHAAGLVHRDVKPQNVLVDAGDAVKLVDFGIARADGGTRLTEAGAVVGTASYLAPELVAGAEATPAADVYALGAVLYELLTGVPPLRAQSLDELAAALGRPIVPVRDLAPATPQELEELVMRCLARLPDYRPASAAELAAGLRAFAPEAPTRPLAPPAAPDPPRRWTLSRPLVLVALVAAAAIAAVAIALAATRGGGRAPALRPARARAVRPVPASVDPVQQARNLSAWLRANAR